MTDVTSVRTDAAVIDSILERGFDPAMPIGREDFLRFLADAEDISAGGPETLPTAISAMRVEYGEIGDALTLPVAVGHRWLLRLLQDSRVVLEDSAITDFVATLVRRLVPVLQQYVQFEALVSRSARNIAANNDSAPDAGPSLIDAWLERWATFPVLASLMTLTLVHWFRAVEEMIRALEAEHADVAARLSGSTSPLSIRAIHGDAGDKHLDGRSVMLLTFSDDAKVVFKPKQLAITDVFRDLVDRINAAGFTPPLRVHEAMVCDGHTWDVYVPHRPCEDEAQVERFYRCMGGWIRLLQIIEGRDFWLDNLIADGEHPIFIDLETIMQPRRSSMPMPVADQRVQDRLEASPLVTNIVAMPVPIGPGIAGEDLACFVTPKPFLSPFRATDIPGADTSDESQHGYRTWTHPEHAPMLNGKPVDAEQWYPAIEAGYRHMAETMDALAGELLEPGGIVDRLSAHPVRTIFRDTWTCVRIIHRSTAPPLLGHYQRRRQFLERMDRESAADAEVTGPVIAAEVRAMLALDVPFFSAYGKDDAIYPPNAELVAGFFDGTARDRLATNLRVSSRERLDEDVALLRTAFWTTHRRTPAIHGCKIPGSGTVRDDDWAAAASRIAEDIADARTTGADGSSSWPALSYHPMADIENLSPIGNDLLSGRSGLIPMFLDEWRKSGEERWRDLATTTSHDVAATIRQVGLPLRDESPEQRSVAPLLLGAFTGVGGMLASVKLAADELEDRHLEESWRDALHDVDWAAALDRSGSDVIGGNIWLALALTARPDWAAHLSDRVRSLCGGIAQDDEQRSGAPYPPTTLEKLGALPGDRVAQMLVRSRLGLTDQESITNDIRSMLQTSLSLGDLLGLAELGHRDAAWWPTCSQLISIAFAERRASADRLEQLQAAELALAMWSVSQDEEWLQRARALGSHWITEFNSTGSWFPNDLADDRYRLSSIRGLPAIASVLRRLDGSSSVAGPMTMNWRPWSAR